LYSASSTGNLKIGFEGATFNSGDAVPTTNSGGLGAQSTLSCASANTIYSSTIDVSTIPNDADRGLGLWFYRLGADAGDANTGILYVYSIMLTVID
jgi:hypothetical protein